jgi:hypothetical protein
MRPVDAKRGLAASNPDQKCYGAANQHIASLTVDGLRVDIGPADRQVDW